MHRRCQLVQAAVGRVDNEKMGFNLWDGVGASDDGGLGGFIGEGFDNKPGTMVQKEYLTVSLAKALHDMGAPQVIDYLSLDIEVMKARASPFSLSSSG